MRNYKVIYSLVFLLSLGFLSEALALDLIAEIKKVGAEEGYLTTEVHERFWAELRKTWNEKGIDSYRKEIDTNILMGFRMQVAFLTSARISYVNRTVVKTSDLIELQNNSRSKVIESISFPVGSKEYIDSVESFDRSYAASIEDGERILTAAANRVGFRSVSGDYVPMSLEVLDYILRNAEIKHTQLENLFDENWKGE